MRHLSLYIVLILLIACKSTAKENKPQSVTTADSTSLAYSRGEYIHYYSRELNKRGTLYNCYNPDLSPDGLHLAYTEYYKSDNSKAAGSNRRVVVMNLSTSTKRYIPYKSEQFYGPVWSNDGSKIASSAFTNGIWQIVLVDSSLRFDKVLKPLSNSGYHAISWTNDDKEILAHNLDTLFVIDTSNLIRQKLLVNEIIGDRGKSSGTVFTLNRDKNFLIFNTDNKEAIFCNGENAFKEGLPFALYKYNLLNESLLKLTPDTLYCSDYTVSDSIIYFTASRKCDAHKRKIYRINLHGQNLKELVTDGNSITVMKKNGG